MAYPSKRDQIVRDATERFKLNGFFATSMDDVIKATLVSRRTMYKHFPSKNSLIAATIEYYCGQYEAEMETHLASVNTTAPIDKLVSLIEFSVNWYKGKQFLGCLVMQAMDEFGGKDASLTDICTEFKRQQFEKIHGLVQAGNLRNPYDLTCELFVILEGCISLANKPQVCEIQSLKGLVYRIIGSPQTSS